MSRHVDYEELLIAACTRDANTLARFLADELPHAWADAYRASCTHSPNLFRISTGSFEYIFDFVQEAVSRGDVSPAEAVEDRVVAVHGRSTVVSEARNDRLMRGRPLGPIDVMPADTRCDYDKGHFMAHSIGGGLEINIFPQVRPLNRGWSERGKVYRAMERCCQDHPGTYCFSRPTYMGRSWHPSSVEYGVLRDDGTFWLQVFENTGSNEEAAEIERLLGPALLRWYGERA